MLASLDSGLGIGCVVRGLFCDLVLTTVDLWFIRQRIDCGDYDGEYIGRRSIPWVMAMGARHKRLSFQTRNEVLGNNR